MEENYSDWEFMLNGNPVELRALTEISGSGYLKFYGGIDHWLDCPSDDFRMTTMYAQAENDASTVWKIGHELLSLYNGASELYQMNSSKISIHRLLYKDKPQNYVAPHEGVALLQRPNFSPARIRQEFEKAKKTSAKQTLVHLATEERDVLFILKYLNMGPGWVSYYKLMEAVEAFAKAKHIDLGTKSQERKAFTNTANNFSLSGFDARHGFKEQLEENKTRSMDLQEAHTFVTSMVKRFLDLAYLQKLA